MPGWGNAKATVVVFAHQGARVFAVNIELGAAGEAKNKTGIHIAVGGGVSLKCE